MLRMNDQMYFVADIEVKAYGGLSMIRSSGQIKLQWFSYKKYDLKTRRQFALTSMC